jgi:hypothetical protein
MSTHNYNLDMERMEAKEKIERLEWELACEKEWTEKLQKIAREHYKSAETARQERDEARIDAEYHKARYDVLRESW